MQNALRLGATAEEIMETIQLTTVLGIHAVNLAVPMLFEELERAGQPVPAPSTPRRKDTARSGSKK
jgi:alkylhydroperoxidase/carboxymuconolactone decarboxylase family protein YurZ